MPRDRLRFVTSYIDWLRSNTHIAEENQYYKITTPFLDRHNDCIQFYVVPSLSGFRLTDDGYVLADLDASGCSIDTLHRRKTLEQILNGFGVHEQDGELFVEASAGDFPQKQQALIQAMLSVGDMFLMAKQRVSTLFWDDVAQYLESKKVRFATNVEITGKTGFAHKFDFLIPKSSNRPERLIRAINNPTRDATTSVLFSWTDTRQVRAPDSLFYVVLNDHDRNISDEFSAAFHEYQVTPILWSNRDSHIEELAA